MLYHFLYVLRHDKTAFRVILVIWVKGHVQGFNYLIDLIDINYLQYIIIVKKCLETIFQFLKCGTVLGMRNVLPKFIAKNGCDLC